MSINNKNYNFEKSIFVRKKSNIKIIQNGSTIIIRNTSKIPKSFVLTNDDFKKEKTIYVLNKNSYNIKNFINKSICNVSKKDDNNSILRFLRMNSNYIKQSVFVHKEYRNKIIISNNTKIVRYHTPYSGSVFEPENKDLDYQMRIKDFSIVAQKYSYIEYYIGFNKNTIKNVTGLPQGMVFNKDCLKGTPMISGDHLITIELDSKTIIRGILKVPRLPRQL